jgi:hypothetical protein
MTMQKPGKSLLALSVDEAAIYAASSREKSERAWFEKIRL